MSMSKPETVLFRADNVVKAFPGTLALDDVSVSLAPGEVRAVVGPNGAGKSTLMKILRGVYQPDKGTLTLDGRQIQPRSPLDAQELGISMVYQELSILPDLDVAENIMLAKVPRNRLGLVDRSALYDQAARLMGQLGVPLPLRTPCGQLSVGQRQMVEILRALSREAKVLICDEPTAALTQQEQKHLAALIERLKESGVAILYVTHHLDEVFAVADSVTVIRDGRNVATEPVERLDPASLVALMLGETRAAESDQARRRRTPTPGEPAAIEVTGLSSDAAQLTDVSLRVEPGEIVGIAGTLGSGCSELLKCLFGAERMTAGEVRVAGRTVKPTSPKAAIDAGIALVPGDRKTQGIFPGQALWKNVAAARLGSFLDRAGLVKRRAALEAARTLSKRVGVKAHSMSQEIDSLSGGNQQKAILARWLLASKPKVLLLDEPTVGVDIGAKREIRKLLRELAAEGVGVVLVSSEFDELGAVCDRVLILRNGQFAGEIDGAAADEHSLLLAVSGGTK